MPFRVALTFDAEHPDRPSRACVTEAILDALAAATVAATFFVQGRWAEADPATVRRIADAGHLIGNHSHYHAPMPLQTDEGFAVDVELAAGAIVLLHAWPAPTSAAVPMIIGSLRARGAELVRLDAIR